MTNQAPALLTKADAAQRLSVSVQTVNRLIKAGRLQAVRIRRRVAITTASVDAIIISGGKQ